MHEFYSKYFLPQIPPDMEMIPVSRTIGQDRVVDDMVARFTHTIPMDWILPGIPPTGKRVEIALVVVVQFESDKLAHEHLYWASSFSVGAAWNFRPRGSAGLWRRRCPLGTRPERTLNGLIRRAKAGGRKTAVAARKFTERSAEETR